MTESAKKEKAPKKSWVKGLKSEFKKIMWTDKKTVAKQAAIVVAVTIVLGAVIAILDSSILGILNLLIK